MADSCSNLNRSRTELLASISSPTCKGRLVSAWKLRISSGGLLSSITRKSLCFISVTRLPCLSVTVNTTLTSLVGTTMVRTRSSLGAAASPGFGVSSAAGLAGAALAGAELAEGGFEDELADGLAGVVADGAAGVAGAELGAAWPAGSCCCCWEGDEAAGSGGAGAGADCAAALTAKSTSTASPTILPSTLVPKILTCRHYSNCSQKLLQLHRQRTLQRDLLSGAGMRQLQLRRVQEIPRQRKRNPCFALLASGGPISRVLRRNPGPFDRLRASSEHAGGWGLPHFPRRPIQLVPDHGMSQRRHVHANLVSSAGINFHFEQRELAVRRIQPAHDAVVRNGLAPAGGPRGHAGAPNAVAADAGRDRPLLFLHPAMHQRRVRLLDFPPGKLRR